MLSGILKPTGIFISFLVIAGLSSYCKNCYKGHTRTLYHFIAPIVELLELRRKISIHKAFPILKYLAMHPGKTRYVLEKELSLDKRTVRAAMEVLEKARCVKVDKAQRWKNEKTIKTYVVTPQGIVALLQSHPDYVKLSISDVGTLAEKQTAFLPLIFGKWDYFCNQKLGPTACKFLLQAAKETRNEVEQLQLASNGKILPWSPWSQDSVHRHDIYEFMLLRAWNQRWKFQERDPGEAWLIALRKDKDLSDMSDKEIVMLTQDVESELRFLKNCRAYFKDERVMPGFAPSGSVEQDDLWKEFKGNVRHERTKALDENRPPPTEEEIVASIMYDG